MIEVFEKPTLSPSEPYEVRFKTFLQTVASKNPPWIKQIRKSAFARFAEVGFPTARNEDWKFTNIAPLLKLPFHPLEAPSRTLACEEVEPFRFGAREGRLLVFVDGHFAPKLSSLPDDEDGLQLGSLRAMLENNSREIEKHLAHYASDANAFTALNTAFFQDGAFVSVPAGRVVEDPVHLLFIAATNEPGAALHPRNLILAQKRSAVKILETYVSLTDAPYFTNAVTEIVVEPDAQIEHCKIQRESENAFHLATIKTNQNKNSRWTSHSISSGARLARNDIQSVLNAEGAECILNGLYLGRGEQLVDHHTVVEHAKPNCESHEFYHGILDGKSRGVFNGKIFVQQDAQKTNAKQTNRNLLLSDDAVVDTKPQLEIFADDVKCTHGATVGQLDEDAIFYLRSRGIGLENARRMLIHAFAHDVVERINLEAVRAELDKFLMERFEGATK